MKLILTRNVAGLGSAGDVVTVADGFARNALIPNGNAIAWTKGGEKQIEGIRRARASREIRDTDHAKQIKAKLESTDFTVKAKVGDTGHLYGTVTDKDLALTIKSAAGVDIDRHKIKLASRIKMIGSYTAKVSIHHGVSADIKINVVAE